MHSVQIVWNENSKAFEVSIPQDQVENVRAILASVNENSLTPDQRTIYTSLNSEITSDGK